MPGVCILVPISMRRTAPGRIGLLFRQRDPTNVQALCGPTSTEWTSNMQHLSASNSGDCVTLSATPDTGSGGTPKKAISLPETVARFVACQGTMDLG